MVKNDAIGVVEGVTLFKEVANLLRVQGELGLQGLELPDDALCPRPVEPPSDRAPSAQASDGENEDLPAIQTSLGNCKRCKLWQGRTHIVFGVGNPKARLVFVGEGPGQDEDLQGEPFVGAAGQLLDRMIRAMGLKRREVYIANIVKCRPPRNRDPEPDEVEACEPFLLRQLRAIKPEVIVALGRCAALTLLRDRRPAPRSLGQVRGRWQDLKGTAFMPTFHPAYLLRYPQHKRAAWQDLQQVMAKLGLPHPPTAT